MPPKPGTSAPASSEGREGLDHVIVVKIVIGGKVLLVVQFVIDFSRVSLVATDRLGRNSLNRGCSRGRGTE